MLKGQLSSGLSHGSNFTVKSSEIAVSVLRVPFTLHYHSKLMSPGNGPITSLFKLEISTLYVGGSVAGATTVTVAVKSVDST